MKEQLRSLKAPVSEPRIPPGSRHDIGLLNMAIARGAGLVTRTGPPHIFTTLARHRRLFRPWLRFAGRLMPRGTLPREDTELLILRTASNCGCEYEWRHHERIGRRAGLGRSQIDALRQPAPEGFSQRQELLLRAADQLHEHRALSEEVFDELRPLLCDAELIEVCMLVGHYEMLAMTLNSLGVQPEG